MKRNDDMISINEAARMYNIAPIRIWCLIRQREIGFKTKRSDTVICKHAFIDWVTNHPHIIAQWQQAFNK